MTMQKMQDPQPFSPTHWVNALPQPQIVQRLHRLTIYGRWLVVLLAWLTVGTVSLWQLRFRIQLLMDSFTWVAVRYGLAYHQGAALGLSICIGMTLAVLIWHSRNLLFGLPQEEQIRLQLQAERIRQQGPTHPLWNLVCRRE